MDKQTANVLFRAVCLCFSAALLVLSLLSAIDLAAVNDRAARLEKEIETLETENDILLARCENSLSLEEVERRAIEELGMQHCTPNQIVYIELSD